MDLSRAHRMPEGQRQLQFDWIETHRKELQTLCRGTALILPSLPARMAVKGFLKFRPLPCPTLVAGSWEEARDWARKQLEG